MILKPGTATSISLVEVQGNLSLEGVLASHKGLFHDELGKVVVTYMKSS